MSVSHEHYWTGRGRTTETSVQRAKRHTHTAHCHCRAGLHCNALRCTHAIHRSTLHRTSSHISHLTSHPFLACSASSTRCSTTGLTALFLRCLSASNVSAIAVQPLPPVVFSVGEWRSLAVSSSRLAARHRSFRSQRPTQRSLRPLSSTAARLSAQPLCDSVFRCVVAAVVAPSPPPCYLLSPPCPPPGQPRLWLCPCPGRAPIRRFAVRPLRCLCPPSPCRRPRRLRALSSLCRAVVS